LSDRCPIRRVPAGGDILDPDGDDITTAKLAVDRQIEHGEVASAAFDLELRPNRPDVLGSQGWLCPGTDEEVSNEDIMKGYKVDTDTYIEVSKDELENIALESTRTIDINEFVPKSDIDPRYLMRPYYLVPDGKVGDDAFAVIRETIRSTNMVAIGRVVLTSREHIIALEPLDNGLMGTLLRYPYEVRDEKEYFDEIQDVKVTEDMLDLAKHIVTQKAADFETREVCGPQRRSFD
jgi:Ku protein